MPEPSTSHFLASDISNLFSRLFLETYETQLVGGAEEPLYEPSRVPGQPHLLYFRADFLGSALHETAHWCIAGRRRRMLTDFGYQYRPDGRSEVEQREFERVEVKPQALEWIFATALGTDFHLSADNLSAATGPSESFRKAVREQALAYLGAGQASGALLPLSRMSTFATALLRLSGREETFKTYWQQVHASGHLPS